MKSAEHINPQEPNKQEATQAPSAESEFYGKELPEAIEQATGIVDSMEAKTVKGMDSQIEESATSLKLDPEKAESIFVGHGFDVKVQAIKEKIKALAAATKEKISGLLGPHNEVKLNPSIVDKEVEKQPIESMQEVAMTGAVGADTVAEEKGEIVENAPRLKTALERLKSKEKIEMGELWPKEALLADGGHIENQQIDIIRTPSGDMKVMFKLTESQRDLLKNKLDESRGFVSGTIKYSGLKVEYGVTKDDQFGFDCYEKEVGIGILRVADSNYRSTHGLVEMVIAGDKIANMSPAELQTEISRILQEQLDIPNGLMTPEENDEKAYKLARYKWFHKTDEVPDGIEKRLKREEVIPGYNTIIEEGKHKEYMEAGAYAVFHSITNYESTLSKIIKAGGLLSTHERYRRGLLINGMSSARDMETGGADSVFVRTMTNKGLAASHKEKAIAPSDVNIVFEPRILDRTDWYAYASDMYGSTEPKEFAERLSPEEALERQRARFREDSEQMFRCGIATQDIKAITFVNVEMALDA